MFPVFWGGSSCGPQPYSRKEYKESRLRFLRWVKEDLETRLAGINAAIETLERQLRESEGTRS
jgi:hypothetical protein